MGHFHSSMNHLHRAVEAERDGKFKICPKGRMYSEKLRAIQPIGEYNSVLEMRQVWELPVTLSAQSTPPYFSFLLFFCPWKILSFASNRSFPCESRANEAIVACAIFSDTSRSRTVISWKSANDIRLYRREEKERNQSRTLNFFTS